ncbi:acetate uptake transporter [Gluconacetobacter tumulisoli]|nr:acetate uptake transporter [Gluconacetobacter tumulisoli]
MVEMTRGTSSQFANPGPLGLMGFGLTTVLLNLHNAGWIPMGSAILAMGLVFGGLAQILAGLLEYPKGNTFGLTAFTSYGAFWLSLVVLVCLPQVGLMPASTPPLMAAYLFMWGIFTLILFIGTLSASRALQVVFGSLVILFMLLAAAERSGNPALTVIAGYEGIFCGFSAIYVAMAEILEFQFGHAILPLGTMPRPRASHAIGAL